MINPKLGLTASTSNGYLQNGQFIHTTLCIYYTSGQKWQGPNEEHETASADTHKTALLIAHTLYFLLKSDIQHFLSVSAELKMLCFDSLGKELFFKSLHIAMPSDPTWHVYSVKMWRELIEIN